MTRNTKNNKKQKQPKAKYYRFITPVVTCGTYCLQINTEYDDGYCYGFDNTFMDAITRYLDYYPELKISEVRWCIHTKTPGDFIEFTAKSKRSFCKQMQELDEAGKLDWDYRR